MSFHSTVMDIKTKYDLIIFDRIIFDAASSDGVARLWNASTGTVEREYQGHQKAVTALAFRDEIVSVN